MGLLALVSQVRISSQILLYKSPTAPLGPTWERDRGGKGEPKVASPASPGMDWQRSGITKWNKRLRGTQVPIPRAPFRHPSAHCAMDSGPTVRRRTHRLAPYWWFGRYRLRLDQESNSPSPRAAGPCPAGSAGASAHGYWQALYLRRFLRILSIRDYQLPPHASTWSPIYGRCSSASSCSALTSLTQRAYPPGSGRCIGLAGCDSGLDHLPVVGRLTPLVGIQWGGQVGAGPTELIVCRRDLGGPQIAAKT